MHRQICELKGHDRHAEAASPGIHSANDLVGSPYQKTAGYGDRQAVVNILAVGHIHLSAAATITIHSTTFGAWAIVISPVRLSRKNH